MNKTLEYLGTLLFSNAYRFLRIFPNNDPVMGSTLAFSRKDKWWQAFLYAVIAMVSFDIITMKLGIWTIGTSLAFGLIAVLFSKYLKNRKKVGLKTYAKSSVFGVLIFDFLTGPIMSSALFRIPFETALLGQLPFTFMHLASAVPLTLLMVPVLDPAIRPGIIQEVSKFEHRLRLLFSRPLMRL